MSDDAQKSPARVHLWVCSGENMGRRFELTQPRYCIGRAGDADIPILDGRASQAHAQILRTADGDYLEDLGSTNGTFVNNEQITAAHKLSEGDRIQIGETVLEYQCELVGPVEPTTSRALALNPAAEVIPFRTWPGPNEPQPVWAEVSYEEQEEESQDGVLALLLKARAAVQFLWWQRTLIVALDILGAALGAGSAALRPPEQTATFEIEIYPPVRNSPLGAPPNHAPFFGRARRAFVSARLIAQTLERMNKSEGTDRQIAAIRSRLAFDNPDPMNLRIHSGSFSHVDGEWALDFLTQHVDTLMETEVAKTLRALEDTVALFKKQLHAAEEGVEAVRRRQRAFEESFQDIQPERRAELTRLTARRHDVLATVARTEELRRLVQARMQEVPKTVKKPVDRDPYRSMIAQKRRQLVEATESGLNPQSQRLVRLRGEIARLHALSKNLADATRPMPNPKFIELEKRLAIYVFDAKAAATDLREVDRRIEALRPIVGKLAERSERAQELSIRLQSAVRKRTRLDEALSQAESQLSVEKVSLKAQYELTMPKLEHFNPLKKPIQRGVLGLFAGMALAVLIGVYRQLRRNPTYAAALSLRDP